MKLRRREFLKLSAAGAVVSGLGILGTSKKLFQQKVNYNIPGQILGPNFEAGHKLRTASQLTASAFASEEVLIVGAGISGLSAGWWLLKNGFKNFKIFELENEVGGNSRGSANTISPYPWGAHYVPVANADAEYLREFFRELGVITGTDPQGRDIYHDDYVCHDPQERLFFKGSWQEGLVPSHGLSHVEHQEMKRFHNLMEKFKIAKGKDGKRAFCIPLQNSSRDREFLNLDKISMKDFLRENQFSTEPLHWYIDYCCRDDYGTTAENVSAWAGIHYFAGRNGNGAGLHDDTVITWPEGNAWLVKKLKEQLSAHLLPESMLVSSKIEAKGVKAKILNLQSNLLTEYTSEQLIFSAPRYLWPYLFETDDKSAKARQSSLTYDPWLVANVSVQSLPKGDGAALAWDNVSYHSPSLGYIVANHQAPEIVKEKSVLTYYLPLNHLPPKLAREEALSKKFVEWRKQIVDDLESMHQGISHHISSIDVWIWGHAMIRPRVDFIWSDERRKMQESLQNRIHFAHSDMSGISIFEEAQFWGVEAAKKVLTSQKRKS